MRDPMRGPHHDRPLRDRAARSCRRRTSVQLLHDPLRPIALHRGEHDRDRGAARAHRDDLAGRFDSVAEPPLDRHRPAPSHTVISLTVTGAEHVQVVAVGLERLERAPEVGDERRAASAARRASLERGADLREEALRRRARRLRPAPLRAGASGLPSAATDASACRPAPRRFTSPRSDPGDEAPRGREA